MPFLVAPGHVLATVALSLIRAFVPSIFGVVTSLQTRVLLSFVYRLRVWTPLAFPDALDELVCLRILAFAPGSSSLPALRPEGELWGPRKQTGSCVLWSSGALTHWLGPGPEVAVNPSSIPTL